MFENPMLEASGAIVDITDIHSRVLHQLLGFMYGGTAPTLADPADALGLLAAADKYMVDGLKVGVIKIPYFS
jgi:hypothetical protein